LGRPEWAAEIALRYRKAKTGWQKTRLLCAKLASEGQHQSAQIAALCGCSTSRVFDWLRMLREGGIEGLLKRGKPGPRTGDFKLLKDKPRIKKQVQQGLAEGRWKTSPQLSRWLKDKHGLEVKTNTALSWLKKLGGVLRVPRPRHPKRGSDVAMEQFKESLGQKLEALQLAQGTKVKVWVMDEARFGLHTDVRRVWVPKGSCPVVERQTKYEWDYLYGSLEVVEGQAHFLHLPTVNLDCDALYLEALAASDRDAVHVVIRDNAGFHLREGDPRLPARVRIVPLPPYSPELNPCEQAWDMVKDEVSNHCFATINKLRDALLPGLKRFWESADTVLSLVGRPWLRDQANASYPV
jgi:transposase